MILCPNNMLTDLLVVKRITQGHQIGARLYGFIVYPRSAIMIGELVQLMD
jgi:hypothetical protein